MTMASNLTRDQARAHAIALANAKDTSSGAALVELVGELAEREEGAAERLARRGRCSLFGVSGRTFWGEGGDGEEVRANAIAVVRAAVLLIAGEPTGSLLTRLDLATVRLARSCLASPHASAVDRADMAEMIGLLLERVEGKATDPTEWCAPGKKEKRS
jgi:hypothetical protein